MPGMSFSHVTHSYTFSLVVKKRIEKVEISSLGLSYDLFPSFSALFYRHRRMSILKWYQKQWEPRRPLSSSPPLTGLPASLSVGSGTTRWVFHTFLISSNGVCQAWRRTLSTITCVSKPTWDNWKTNDSRRRRNTMKKKEKLIREELLDFCWEFMFYGFSILVSFCRAWKNGWTNFMFTSKLLSISFLYCQYFLLYDWLCVFQKTKNK